MFRTKSRASSKAVCKEHQASAQRAIRKRREAKEKRGLREWEWERKRRNTFNTFAGPEDGLLGELELVALIVLSESCETFSGERRGEEGQCFEGPRARAGRRKREERRGRHQLSICVAKSRGLVLSRFSPLRSSSSKGESRFFRRTCSSSGVRGIAEEEDDDEEEEDEEEDDDEDDESAMVG